MDTCCESTAEGEEILEEPQIEDAEVVETRNNNRRIIL